MRAIAVLLVATLLLAGCSKRAPPQGRWEGTYESADTFIAARLLITPDGMVSVSAPDVVEPGLSSGDRARMRQTMAERLAGAWGDIAPRRMDFDGTTFRKPGGIAPQMEWDKDTNTMRVYVYLGTREAIEVPLHPVADFSDNPWPH